MFINIKIGSNKPRNLFRWFLLCVLQPEQLSFALFLLIFFHMCINLPTNNPNTLLLWFLLMLCVQILHTIGSYDSIHIPFFYFYVIITITLGESNDGQMCSKHFNFFKMKIQFIMNSKWGLVILITFIITVLNLLNNWFSSKMLYLFT